MIIVSQDKKEVINYETVDFIDIVPMDDGRFEVDANFAHCITELGYYAREERAKEVLQEIVKKYSSYLELKGGPAIIQGQMDIQPNIFNIPKVYVMPLE